MQYYSTILRCGFIFCTVSERPCSLFSGMNSTVYRTEFSVVHASASSFCSDRNLVLSYSYVWIKKKHLNSANAEKRDFLSVLFLYVFTLYERKGRFNMSVV